MFNVTRHLDEMVTEKIKQGFHTNQSSRVLKCIRPNTLGEGQRKGGPNKKICY